jgi:transposase
MWERAQVYTAARGAAAMSVVTIGLDLAKSVFQVHGVDAAAHTVLRRRLGRTDLLPFFAKQPPCVIGMEACSSAHHWARELSRLGHLVRLIPPQYVKPYVKRNKTDAADAEAICEAVGRPNMRFVPIKTIEQQRIADMQIPRVEIGTERGSLSPECSQPSADTRLLGTDHLNLVSPDHDPLTRGGPIRIPT